ncbi:MAG: hydrogenase, partial [Gammaproteobacteria bacterium]|nr:hydrogenase [Gammaproteobacteria bacterium]
MQAHLNKLQQGLSANQRLQQIVTHGMCIGCGICESLSDNISVELVHNGFERPLVSGELDDKTMDTITAVCPGTRLEGLPPSLTDPDAQTDPVWGVIQENYLAYSADPEVRHLASTGGLLTGLALYLLDSGECDFIVHARASEQHPSFGEPCISRNRADVLHAAGSRYGPTATLRHIHAALDEAQQQQLQFAFIGTPCDVSALRNLARIDPRVDQHCQ